MATICSDHDLVDILKLHHPDDSHIPSYARSCNRLDYVLVSQELVPDVTHTGLNHYHEMYPSDHRPIYVGLHERNFGPRQAIVPARSRIVNSNSTIVAAFVSHAYRHLLDTGSFNNLCKLSADLETLAPPKLSEPFFRQITNANAPCGSHGQKSCIW
jgi:hypothetical protein